MVDCRMPHLVRVKFCASCTAPRFACCMMHEASRNFRSRLRRMGIVRDAPGSRLCRRRGSARRARGDLQLSTFDQACRAGRAAAFSRPRGGLAARAPAAERATRAARAGARPSLARGEARGALRQRPRSRAGARAPGAGGAPPPPARGGRPPSPPRRAREKAPPALQQPACLLGYAYGRPALAE